MEVALDSSSRIGPARDSFRELSSLKNKVIGKLPGGKQVLQLEGGELLNGVNVKRVLGKMEPPKVKKGFWEKKRVTIRTQDKGLVEVRAESVAKLLGVSEDTVRLVASTSKHGEVTGFVKHMQEKQAIYEKQFDDFVSFREGNLQEKGRDTGITKEQLLKMTAMDFYIESHLTQEVRGLEEEVKGMMASMGLNSEQDLFKLEEQLTKDYFNHPTSEDRGAVFDLKVKLRKEGPNPALEQKIKEMNENLEVREKKSQSARFQLQKVKKFRNLQEAKRTLEQKQEGSSSWIVEGTTSVAVLGDEIHTFQKGKELGKGLFGEAHLLETQAKTDEKAMKVLKGTFSNPESVEDREKLQTNQEESFKDMQSERRALKDIKAESEKGGFVWRGVQDPPEKDVYAINGNNARAVGYIGTAYAGDLGKLRKDHSSLSRACKFQVLEQMLHGLMICEHAGRVNTDIKPGNVFFKGEGRRIEVKIADFGGVDKASERGIFDNESPNFTQRYTPPEGIAKSAFLEDRRKMATWSTALTFLEVSRGKDLTEEELIDLQNGSLEILDAEDSGLTEEMKVVLKGCLQIDPEKRLGGKEAWMLLHETARNSPSTSTQLSYVVKKWEGLYSGDQAAKCEAYQAVDAYKTS